MKQRTLIFGVDGFSGLHLWRCLKDIEGNDIIGTYNRKPDSFKRNILKGCKILQCDIDNYPRIKEILAKVSPCEIYFLPAVVTVARSFEMAALIYQTNVLGAAKFFEAVIQVCPNAKILLVGSAEEYGKVNQQSLPIVETQELKPVSPYGLSKVMQERLAEFYRRNYRLFVNTTRTFHFAGPWQPSSFVVSDFASQIARIELRQKDPVIYVGNLKARRDFTDIRDVVMAYYLIMKRAKTGETFNICSGHSVEIKEILDLLIEKGRVKITVSKDRKRMRPLDVPDFIGNNSAVVNKIGWRPRITLNQTLDDVLNWWREHLEREIGSPGLRGKA